MTFQAMDPFEVDNGELDTIKPVNAFSLGVEWGLIYSRIQARDEFHNHPIHTDNQRRIQALLSRWGYEQNWDLRDDWSFVTAQVAPSGVGSND